MDPIKSDLAEWCVPSRHRGSFIPRSCYSWTVNIGHEAVHTIRFDQGNDSTKVTFSLAGVPTGLEDELRRNLEGY